MYKWYKIVFILIISVIAITELMSTTYYVSDAIGDDNRTSQEAQNPNTPWKTIHRVNLFMENNGLQPGDSVLFMGGDVFRGQLNVIVSGSPGLPIVFGRYGADERPVFSGSILIEDWMPYSGNIYIADVYDSIAQLFVDGIRQTIARYPDTGFLYVDQGNENYGFFDLELVQPTGYWSGAVVRIHTIDWAWEFRRVQNFYNSYIEFDRPTSYAVTDSFGYYLENKLSELTSPGEWYYDPSAQHIYLWAPNSGNPNNMVIEGSVYDHGIYLEWGVSYIIIRDIEFKYYKDIAILGYSNNHIRIINNRIIYTQGGAMYLSNSPNYCVIDSNIIEDNLGCGGIELVSASQCTLSYNIIKRCGILHGYSLWKDYYNRWTYGGMGIFLQGTGYNNYIAYNKIDSIGYCGIMINNNFGDNNCIEKNIISYTSLGSNDQGGIYTYAFQGYGNRIINNFVFYILGRPVAAPSGRYITSPAIYIDNLSNNVEIIGNTAAYSQYGIFINRNSYGEKIIGNVLYNNSVQFHSNEGDNQNLVVKNNIFYCLSDTQWCFTLSDDVMNLGMLDSNYYCNPYDDYVIKTRISDNTTEYTLVRWKLSTVYDANSKPSLVKWLPYKVIDTLGPNMITNPTFTDNISGWTSWPSNCYIFHDIHSKLDGGCMKILFHDTSQSNISQVWADPFGYTQGQQYLLIFSAVANKVEGIDLTVQARQHHNPWQLLGLNKTFSIDTARRVQEVIFTATQTDPNSRFNFETYPRDSIVWVDNVYLYPVNAVWEDPQLRSPLFVNQTDEPLTINLGDTIYRDLDGNVVSGNIILFPFSSTILTVDSVISEDTEEKIQHGLVKYELKPIFPNPAKGRVMIYYISPECSFLSLKIYNSTGQLVKTLVEGIETAGSKFIIWNGISDQNIKVSSGIYFCSFRARDFIKTQKFLFIKE